MEIEGQGVSPMFPESVTKNPSPEFLVPDVSGICKKNKKIKKSSPVFPELYYVPALCGALYSWSSIFLELYIPGAWCSWNFPVPKDAERHWDVNLIFFILEFVKNKNPTLCSRIYIYSLNLMLPEFLKKNPVVCSRSLRGGSLYESHLQFFRQCYFL